MNNDKDKEEFYYDKFAAAHVVSFFPKFLRHTKGQWAGQPFTLSKWQQHDIIEPIFGWKQKNGIRKYKTAYIEIPRKNGKSTLCTGFALYLLVGDGEPGAEIYSAAASKDQAGIIFRQAGEMVKESTALLKHTKVYRNSIVFPQTHSSYKVLSAEAYTQHGLNPHGIVFDELHAQPTRDLYDVLNTSMGARRQPLMVMITTAGFDRNSICYEMHHLSQEVLRDPSVQHSHFAYIAGAKEEDDWTSPRVWAIANPALGQTITTEYLATQCQQAQMSPAYQNTFRRLHLNQWTQQENRWIDMFAWDKCGLALPDLKGRECWAGLDLASTTDIAALVLVFPPQSEDEPTWLLPFFYIPKDNMLDRVRRDKVPYDVWVKQGHIKATPGNVIDYSYIEADIQALGEKYEIGEIAFDRWGATQISQRLSDMGFAMVEFGQGFASMSAPSKEFLRLILSQKIAHGSNPVLRWMANNVSTKQDPAGNVKPDKEKSTEKIDGIVAAIMGLDRAIRGNGGSSVYEGQGIRSI